MLNPRKIMLPIYSVKNEEILKRKVLNDFSLRRVVDETEIAEYRPIKRAAGPCLKWGRLRLLFPPLPADALGWLSKIYGYLRNGESHMKMVKYFSLQNLFTHRSSTLKTWFSRHYVCARTFQRYTCFLTCIILRDSKLCVTHRISSVYASNAPLRTLVSRILEFSLPTDFLPHILENLRRKIKWNEIRFEKYIDSRCICNFFILLNMKNSSDLMNNEKKVGKTGANKWKLILK